MKFKLKSLAPSSCLFLLVLAGCLTTTADPAAREARTLGGVRQLTRDFADATDAAFSPDGQWLAFRAVPRGEETAQLFLARVRYDGDQLRLGQPIRVTPPRSRSSSPAFSPDGRTFLFTSTAQGDDDPPRQPFNTPDFDRLADLFRVDGWQRDMAAADPRAGVNFARRKVAARPGYDAEPAFTPDGRFVLFVSDRDASPGSRDLYAMRPDGGNVVRLTGDPGHVAAPVVSPDGRRVVFPSDRATPGKFDLYEIALTFDGEGSVAASNARRLTWDAGATQPTFTPDGAGLIYATNRDDRRGVGNVELHYLELSSRRDTRLTFDPAADDSPRVGRDGRFLIFSSRRTVDGSRQLFVARFESP